jgi:hypothetical protein
LESGVDGRGMERRSDHWGSIGRSSATASVLSSFVIFAGKTDSMELGNRDLGKLASLSSFREYSNAFESYGA